MSYLTQLIKISFELIKEPNVKKKIIKSLEGHVEEVFIKSGVRITFLSTILESLSNRLTEIENRLRFPRRAGKMDWEVAVNKCKVLYIDWINNKALLYNILGLYSIVLYSTVTYSIYSDKS